MRRKKNFCNVSTLYKQTANSWFFNVRLGQLQQELKLLFQLRRRIFHVNIYVLIRFRIMIKCSQKLRVWKRNTYFHSLRQKPKIETYCISCCMIKSNLNVDDINRSKYKDYNTVFIVISVSILKSFLYKRCTYLGYVYVSWNLTNLIMIYASLLRY